MAGAIHAYLSADHERLGAALARSLVDGAIDAEAFDTFRRGLLRHIGLEERILIPAAKKAGADVAALAERLRKDHSLLAALLVPSPSVAGIARIREILAEHDVLEERAGGLYDLCERAVGDALVERLREAPEVPVRPHFDGRRPRVLEDDDLR